MCKYNILQKLYMLTYSIYTLIYHNSQGEIYKICVAVNALNIVRSTLSKKKKTTTYFAHFSIFQLPPNAFHTWKSTSYIAGHTPSNPIFHWEPINSSIRKIRIHHSYIRTIRITGAGKATKEEGIAALFRGSIRLAVVRSPIGRRYS